MWPDEWIMGGGEEKETDRQTDKQTETERDRVRERDTDRQTNSLLCAVLRTSIRKVNGELRAV